MSSYNIRPPQDKVNSLAKKYNYSDNNKDGENVIDKGKAKNYSNKSDNSSDTVDNNARDGNSSSNNEDNEARGYIGQQGLLIPITS